MTIKELILENDNFAHSEEAFEIYKESAELSVLNAWIECQQHKAFSGTTMFTESEDNAVAEAEKKSEAKEEALHQKIWGTITRTAKRVWNAIVKLFNKILRVFGVMRMPVLTKENKEALLKGEYMSKEIEKLAKTIMNIYRSIPYITDDSFANLADRGTRNIVSKLTTKDDKNLYKMAVTQIAYVLTGQKEIIAPSVIMAAKDTNSGIVAQARARALFELLIRDAMSDANAAKIVGDLKPYRTYSIEDFEAATKSIEEGIGELKQMEESARLEKKGTAGLNVIIELANRDLKIVTAMAQIQGYLKDFADKVAADNTTEDKKKK